MLWASVCRAADVTLQSRIGYTLLSVIPVLGVGAAVWLHDGWFAVIENADNLSVVAAAVQGALIMLSRGAQRRRPGRSASSL